MRTKLFLGVIFIGFLMIAFAFAQPATASPDEGGKNLKILPKTMSKAEIKKLMKGVADSLGVQCDFCHDTEDFSKDTEHKEEARDMMKMTAELNKNWFKGKPRVTCMTCHNGKKEPAGNK